MPKKVATNVHGVKWSMPVAHKQRGTSSEVPDNVFRLGLTYLAICDTTIDVERNLRAVSAFEAGSKSDHYRIE